MKEISFLENSDDFEIINNDINSDLINIKRCNNSRDLSLIQKKDYDKIIEDDYEIIKLNTDLFFDNEKNTINEEKNTINEEKNIIVEEKNIIEEKNINETLNKITNNKSKNNENDIDNDEFQDFENIELKEEEKGDFTEITISTLSTKNSKSKDDNKIKDQNKLLLSLYQQLNFGTNNTSNKLNKTCIDLGRNNSDKNKYELVKLMSVQKSIKMSTWKDNFKSFMSSIYYNGYAIAKKFDKDDPDIPIYIFDRKMENVVRAEIKFLLKTFLYMSYRSGLVNLNCIGGGDFTSDCGWGCMLRCCQMMLSKGLIQKKMNDFYKTNKKSINKTTLENIRKETLFLFSDNYLNKKKIKNHPDFQYYFDLHKNLSKTNSEYKSISEVIPPYSIYILCILGKTWGEYTSDIKIVKLFTKINEQLFPNFNMLFFECGLISKKKLISAFCEEYNHSNSKINYLDTIAYNGNDYVFKKEGLVFISFRFGLNELEPNYYDVIPLFFKKFKNNIGFVSGKKNKAYYFVGVDKNQKLIFFDPHYNQQINTDINKNYESYSTENIYLLDIKNLSSELTLGIGIFNSGQFIQFLDDIKWFVDNFKDKCVITLSKD